MLHILTSWTLKAALTQGSLSAALEDMKCRSPTN